MFFGKKLENLKEKVPSDIEISQSIAPLPITQIAKQGLGLLDEELIPYGSTKSKIDFQKVMQRVGSQPQGNYIVVTGINPTPLGEGKSTTTIGIAQALGAHLDKKVVDCLRQPSMGPTFGVKGGAAGGGYSQVIPMDEFNLHITGDIHAVSAATNLLAAAIDTRIFHEETQSDTAFFNRLCPVDEKTKKRMPFASSMLQRLRKLGIEKTDPDTLTPEEISKFAKLNIDVKTVQVKRVVDCNDRMLREITIGQGKEEKGKTRVTGFDISVASEVMAVLALATSLKDMRERIGKIVFASDKNGNPLTTEDLGVAGAMTVLMKDAFNPTLMQTIEHTPVMIHAGPFANIASGNNSIVADQVALRLVGEEGYVLTEAGFGADIGAEKFFNLKCRYSGLLPSAAVIVASIRAIKVHGGCELHHTSTPNVEYVRKGCANVIRHIENMNSFGVPVIVCINRFHSDSDEEVQVLREECLKAGAFDSVESNHWAKGGLGAVDVAKSIVKACKEQKSNFKFTYPLDLSIKEKIETIAKNIYRADGVEFSEEVEQKIALFTKQGFSNLPICMAKTQYSFSADAELKGAPTGFKIPIKDIRLYNGAGYLVPLCGPISTIPGLPTRPAYFDIDIDTETGKINGLF